VYEHYEPSERVFVDREEYLEWMENALDRCKKESVVLHLRGIGGIGKSSLVEHWNNSAENGVVLDLSRVSEFYDRLDVLAKSAVRFGIRLRRFDVLWHIRQRFIKGVEPSREKGRGWVMEVLAPIDALGIPVVSVSRAISVIGKKIKPILTGKLDDLGNWLQTRLGEDYAERLLEVLWKEPSHAEFLYLDALVEDLNNRKEMDKPVLVMLDGFEAVDSENLRWRYEGRNISESELWYIFLSSLKNCVGIVASRQPPPPKIVKDKKVEESELTELDEESCRELLDRKGIPDKNLQTKIVSVSGGNPFVINCISDIQDSAALSIEDVEKLGADTLAQVRVKTWRRMFRETDGLLDIIDRAGLVPYIDRQIMEIIAPSMKSAHWDKLTQLSFVRDQGDGTWTLHDLARELVLTELGENLVSLTDEVSDSLEQVAMKESDYRLLGMALSSICIVDESKAITRVQNTVDELMDNNQYMDAHELLAQLTPTTENGRALIQRLRGKVYYWINRVVEAEESFREAIQLYKKLSAANPESKEFMSDAARSLTLLGGLLRKLDKPSESKVAYWEAIALYKELARKDREYLKNVAETLCGLTYLLLSRHREKEAEDAVNEALEIYGELIVSASDPDVPVIGTANTLILSGRLLTLQDRLSEAEVAYRRAIELYRDLSRKTPDSYLKRVGYTLHRLAYILLRRHNARGAEESLREELEIFNTLAKKSPEAYKKDRARGLASLGYLLFCTARPSKAEETLREALHIFRELALEAPKAYSDSLANCLNDLGRVLRENNRHEEAEQMFQEALGLYRDLAQDAPEVYSFGECASCQIGITLQELAHLYRMTNRLFEAEDAYREAINLSRAIASNIPHHRHSFLVSRMLHDYAILLLHTNRFSEAGEVLREGLDIYRDLSKKAPEAYMHVVAPALNNLAILLRYTSRASEAEEVQREALVVYERLSKEFPELFLGHYASMLNNHGVLLRDSDNLAEAERLFQEALEIKRNMAEMAPDFNLPRVDTTLNNLSVLYRQTGRLVDAETIIREVIDIRRRLALNAPKVFLAAVATAMNNYGVVLSETNKPKNAEAAFREALKIRRELVEEAPELHRSQMASVLNNLGIFLGQTKRHEEAEKLHREAIKIWEKLTEVSSIKFEGHLAKAFGNLYVHISRTVGDDKAAKKVLRRLSKMGITDIPSREEWSEEVDDEELWFHEIFYHWSDCPFCV
jgi:tetratricopeptide (TPR) repeat protein